MINTINTINTNTTPKPKTYLILNNKLTREGVRYLKLCGLFDKLGKRDSRRYT